MSIICDWKKEKDFIIGTPRANYGKKFSIFGTGSSGDRMCYVFSKIKIQYWSLLSICNGLYRKASPKTGTFITLQVYERVGISRVDVYGREGKPVI